MGQAMNFLHAQALAPACMSLLQNWQYAHEHNDTFWYTAAGMCDEHPQHDIKLISTLIPLMHNLVLSVIFTEQYLAPFAHSLLMAAPASVKHQHSLKAEQLQARPRKRQRPWSQELLHT